LHTYLEQAFPTVHGALTKEVVGDYSLLYTWKGSQPQLKPILLMAHVDVVPVVNGTDRDWLYSPFEGHIADGFIWGRGTFDDKAGVLGIFEATEMLLKGGFQPERTVYCAFGHDEEVGGQNGAAAIATLLASRGVQLEYVLDEGGLIADGSTLGMASPVALVGIAEKGYASIELTVESEGGHSSMPPRRTAIGILASAIDRLEEHRIRAQIEGPIRQAFDYLAPEMPLTKRMVCSNLWCFGWLVKRKLARSPVTDALLRTTTAPTIVRGGLKENALPIRAQATVNLRIHPRDTIEKVVTHVRKAVNDSRVKVVPMEGQFRTEPSGGSSLESASFRLLHRTIRELYPDVLVVPYLVVGATDSRHYRTLSEDIFRFTPLRIKTEEMKMVHGTNEHLCIEDYVQSIRFYVQLIRNSTL
jgi:carboxypeptidase PM20D1